MTTSIEMQSHEAIVAPEKGALSFQERFDAILSRQLDPRTIDTFADEALDDLIQLIADITAQVGESDKYSGKATEDRALVEAGLDPNGIESALDHIASVADSVRRLDTLIAEKTRYTDTVILPPKPGQGVEINPGDGNFENPKQTLPKLRTLLLLLEQGLEIDIESDDVTITAGAVRGSMMRRASYQAVKIESLNRLVLSCDEVGNRTYVFDTNICEEYGIDDSYISAQNKAELGDLLSGDPRLGRSYAYTKRYTDHILAALTERFGDNESVSQEKYEATFNILEAKTHSVPEGFLSVNGIAVEYDFHYSQVSSKISEINDWLGEVEMYRNRAGKTLQYFSPDQIRIIVDSLEARERPPENYVPLKRISEACGRSYSAIKKVIEDLGDELGGVREYASRSRSLVSYYSPSQVDLILSKLARESRPNDHLSASGIADVLGVAVATVRQAANDLGDKLGEVYIYRNGQVTIRYYNSRQVELITSAISPADVRPEGHLTAHEIAMKLGVTHKRLYGAIEDLAGEIGDVEVYRKGTNKAPHYSPIQIELIAAKLSAVETRPENYLSGEGIARAHDLSWYFIKKAVRNLEEELGEIRLYRSGTRIVPCYSPDQIEIIVEHARSRRKQARLGRAAHRAVAREE